MIRDFVHTSYYSPTMTTTDDPLLRVVEIDNGRSWLMTFSVGRNLIDVINMEYLRGTEIHELVKELTVFDEEGNVIGTVESRIRYALEEYVPDCVLSSFEMNKEINE